MAFRGIYELGHIEDMDYLVVACTRCERCGRYAVSRLIKQHGPRKRLTFLRAEIAADCPKLNNFNIYDLCGVYFPDVHARIIAMMKAEGVPIDAIREKRPASRLR